MAYNASIVIYHASILAYPAYIGMSNASMVDYNVSIGTSHAYIVAYPDSIVTYHTSLVTDIAFMGTQISDDYNDRSSSTNSLPDTRSVISGLWIPCPT